MFVERRCGAKMIRKAAWAGTLKEAWHSEREWRDGVRRRDNTRRSVVFQITGRVHVLGTHISVT